MCVETYCVLARSTETLFWALLQPGIRAQETPQSVRISLLSPVHCWQPGVGDATWHPAVLSLLMALALLLPGAACAAPDADLGEINNACVVWLSSSASFTYLAVWVSCTQSYQVLPSAFFVPAQNLLPYCILGTAFTPLAWSATLLSNSHSALGLFSVLPFHPFFFKERF